MQCIPKIQYMVTLFSFKALRRTAGCLENKRWCQHALFPWHCMTIYMHIPFKSRLCTNSSQKLSKRTPNRLEKKSHASKNSRIDLQEVSNNAAGFYLEYMGSCPGTGLFPVSNGNFSKVLIRQSLHKRPKIKLVWWIYKFAMRRSHAYTHWKSSPAGWR